MRCIYYIPVKYKLWLKPDRFMTAPIGDSTISKVHFLASYV